MRKKQRKKHLFSEFHSPKNSKNTLFGIPLPLKTRDFRNSTPLIFGIPLPSKRALSPLNKGTNEFLKSILKYNKSLFYFKRKIRVNFFIVCKYLLYFI